MPAARVAAYAKINLALRILAREASGFHDLETLFCRIALADDVVVRVGERSERSLSCTGDALPEEGLGAPEENLAWRAAEAYADYDNWPRGFTWTSSRSSSYTNGKSVYRFPFTSSSFQPKSTSAWCDQEVIRIALSQAISAKGVLSRWSANSC